MFLVAYHAYELKIRLVFKLLIITSSRAFSPLIKVFEQLTWKFRYRFKIAKLFVSIIHLTKTM